MKGFSVFGSIIWVRSRRAKNLSVKITTEGLKVTMPERFSEKQAMEFLHKEYDKILQKQKKLKERSEKTLLDENKSFPTATFIVNFIRTERKDVFFILKQGKLIVEIPQNADFESKKIQQACWNGINYFLRKEAKRVLPIRVKELAIRHGFKFQDVKIQSSKTRWGSCSGKKNINLSYYLMLVPDYLYEYVILHELCHTIEMNHGAKFWNLMNKVTDGKALELRKELKKYQIPDY